MKDLFLPKITHLSLFVLAALLAACGRPSQPVNSASMAPSSSLVNEGVYSVEPVFEEFYAYLGGVEVLGPAISPLRESRTLKIQYVENGLMVYDPLATPSDRFQLAPLGVELGMGGRAVPDPGLPNRRYIAGHVIDPDFLDFYEKLGGARFAGRPITEARHDFENRRIEQYFENLGFYRLEDDPSGKVRLLAYGVLACNRQCRYEAPSNAIPGLRPPLPEPFASKAASLGLSFTGLTLSEPYKAPDGKLEVIFENVVLAAGQEEAGEAFARPIVEMLGIQPQPMHECQASELETCLPGEGGQGHKVPLYFEEYISRHGGLDLFGYPITEVFLVENGLYRQCFTNVCLDFSVNAPEAERLKPAPLGKTYQERYSKFWEQQFEDNLDGVQIKVWEKEAMVASGQPQEIHVKILEDETPLVNREPVLRVTLPDGKERIFHFAPTDENGESFFSLPAIDGPNGTLIPYDVCLTGISRRTLCVGDNFLIWESP
jgi:hypothetical protein